jgi:flagella basal body P-ring formation protein FlgA
MMGRLPRNRLRQAVTALCALWLPLCGWPAAAQDVPWTIHVTSQAALEEALVAGVVQRLAPLGVRVEPQGARITMSRMVAVGSTVRVHPRWQDGEGPTRLPLAFSLEALPASGPPAPPPVSASLLAVVKKDVLVARRALRRGVALACDDTEVAARSIDEVPKDALGPKCDGVAAVVTRRGLGRGDVLRRGDLGAAPDVAAQGDVRLISRVGGITVERAGTSLEDADRGREVLVRIAGTSRTTRGVVVDRGLVELKGEMQ